MANIIYKTLLLIVHILINIYSFATNVFFSYKYAAQSFYGKFGDKNIDFNNDSKSLNKLPVHIGIIVTDDIFCLSDISSVILWCIGIGISYISVYDPNGFVKRERNQLEQETKHKQQNIKQLQESCFQIYTHEDLMKKEIDSPNADSKVILLSRADCRNDIILTTRKLAMQTKCKQLKQTDINTKYVDASLQEHWGFPDPELLLTFGKVESLMGYLPWQSRLSEILSIPSLHNIKYTTFLSKLQQYAHTKQRFGR